jgi:carboxymethylenebutenolidase
MPTNTSIPTLDGKSTIPAYVVKPAGMPRGAIIVIQEIFGVNPGIAKKTEGWARRVLAPAAGVGIQP